MKLILDFGNTLQKAAVFDGNEMLLLHKYNVITIADLMALKDIYPIKKAILSSVVNYDNSIKEYLNSAFSYIELDEKTNVPIVNNYLNKDTLGKDRLAAIVAAQHIYKGQNTLVVNAGTCITFDFINDKKEYLGGAISPGVEMKFKALNNFTDKLPLIEGKNNVELKGNTTEGSILSGVINGSYFEIKATIEEYRNKYNDLKVILSGGDRIYFEKRFDESVSTIENIVTIGLNLILDFNAK